MATTMKGTVAVEDVNVTFEDQQKINKFARNTSRMTELKNEIQAKKKSLQNLQDASDDLMMLDDDTLLIPYQIGDVFVSHTQEETQEMLEAAKRAMCWTFLASRSDFLESPLVAWQQESRNGSGIELI
ncbi:prefoldin subunit 4 isoform X3 [Siniperca chuatsi]|uniref:prefoldin subunit 4 isoform X3 n=1 Tax=Siniperca chuatsi TaxID=119488 RepID=UPI001CE12716|nr:prefoldin subunit 4 isoform X3 [Siniperca chuatsi]